MSVSLAKKRGVLFMVSTEIFATQSRKEILDECGITYSVDQDLNLVFKTVPEKEKAVRILDEACEL